MHGRRTVLGACPRGPGVSRTPLRLLPLILALGCGRRAGGGPARRRGAGDGAAGEHGDLGHGALPRSRSGSTSSKRVVDGRPRRSHPRRSGVFAFTPRHRRHGPLGDARGSWSSAPTGPCPRPRAYRGRLDLGALLPDRPDLEPPGVRLHRRRPRDPLPRRRLRPADRGRPEVPDLPGPPGADRAGGAGGRAQGPRPCAGGEDPAAPRLGGGREGPGLHLHQRRHEAGTPPISATSFPWTTRSWRSPTCTSG